MLMDGERKVIHGKLIPVQNVFRLEKLKNDHISDRFYYPSTECPYAFLAGLHGIPLHLKVKRGDFGGYIIIEAKNIVNPK